MSAVNIDQETGRRTLVVEPEWHPRPDGFQRATVFQPGFNSDPDAPPARNYGVHGMEITWYLRGGLACVWLRIYTGWTPGDLAPGHGLPPKRHPRPYEAPQPSGAGLGYCASIRQYEGQEMDPADCPLIGGPCYSDVSYMGADETARAFVEQGEPAVWAALESRYADLRGMS